MCAVMKVIFAVDDPEPVEQLKEEVSCKPRSMSLFKHVVEPQGSIDENVAIPRRAKLFSVV